jgi:hypothetical protein
MHKILPMVLTAVMLFQQARADTDMHAPPPIMESSEKKLDGDKIANLRCLEEARKRVVLDLEADAGSERISWRKVYGYVSRYDILKEAGDDRGGITRIHTVLVLWTLDCKALHLATYPMYKLPTGN